MINNILNTGFQGIQQASNKASEAAQTIASQSIEDDQSRNTTTGSSNASNSDSKELTNAIVQLRQAEIETQANARVVETASDLIGSILDVKV